MPSGRVEITYIAEHSLLQEAQSYETWLTIALIPFPILTSLALAIWYFNRKKLPQTKKHEGEVDVDKILHREKYLRPEEVQVIHFLAEKNGTAFEAELYEKLNLPRTTTWRLIKRLQKMEIVIVTKSRRQNIVSIKRKYLKK
jgi:uncharacterized membrane protein